MCVWECVCVFVLECVSERERQMEIFSVLERQRMPSAGQLQNYNIWKRERKKERKKEKKERSHFLFVEYL